MGDEKLSKCVAYVNVIQQLNQCSKNQTWDDSLDDQRGIIHDEVCKLFNVDRFTMSPISSRLDIWIDLDIDNMAPAHIAQKGQELHDLLDSDLVKRGSYSEIDKEYKKRRDAWWDK